jgi:hypothetical protein
MRIDISLEGIDDTLAGLDLLDRAVVQGVVSGLNKIGAQGVTQSVRSITRMFNIKTGEVKKGVRLIKASARREGRMFATIRAADGSFPLYKFGGRPREPVSQRGIPKAAGRGGKGGGRPYPGRRRASFKLRRAGARMEVPHGFLVRGRGGRVGIYERTGPRSMPIREMRSVGVASMFQMSARSALDRLMRDKAPGILRHEIAYRVERARTGEAGRRRK